MMRGIFIVIGAALLQKFHWIIYIFGAFLVFTGIKFMLQGDEEVQPDRNPLYRLFKRIMPMVPNTAARASLWSSWDVGMPLHWRWWY